MMCSSSAGRSGFSRTAGVGARIQNGFEDDSRAFATERQRARSHLVEHCAEGEQVGSSVEFLGPDLLGRHVGDRAERRTGAGEMFVGDEGRGLRILCGDLAGGTGRKRNLGQAEVQNLRMSALGYENVGRFDVAMHDTFA